MAQAVRLVAESLQQARKESDQVVRFSQVRTHGSHFLVRET